MILITLFYILSVGALVMSVIYFKLMFESVQVRSQKLYEEQMRQLSCVHIRQDMEMFLRIEEDIERRGAVAAPKVSGRGGLAPTALPYKFNEREAVNEL